MEKQTVQIFRVEEDHEYEIVFDIRSAVFQEEFSIDEEDELDGNDHIAQHYLAVIDEKAVGTSRWRISLGGKVRLERIAVLKPYRGAGVGKALMERMMSDIPRDREVYLQATMGSVLFYEKFGFKAEGEQFNEAGVLQQKMILS